MQTPRVVCGGGGAEQLQSRLRRQWSHVQDEDTNYIHTHIQSNFTYSHQWQKEWILLGNTKTKVVYCWMSSFFLRVLVHVWTTRVSICREIQRAVNVVQEFSCAWCLWIVKMAPQPVCFIFGTKKILSLEIIVAQCTPRVCCETPTSVNGANVAAQLWSCVFFKPGPHTHPVIEQAQLREKGNKVLVCERR